MMQVASRRVSGAYGRLSLGGRTILAYSSSHLQLPSRMIASHSFNHFETAVSTLRSTIDTSSTEFKNNASEMSELVASLEQLHRKIMMGGPEKARQKHLDRKKMLVREYVRDTQIALP